jgi:hypothetical protein
MEALLCVMNLESGNFGPFLKYLYGEKSGPRTEDRGFPNTELCRMAFRTMASLLSLPRSFSIQYPLSSYKMNK